MSRKPLRHPRRKNQQHGYAMIIMLTVFALMRSYFIALGMSRTQAEINIERDKQTLQALHQKLDVADASAGEFHVNRFRTLRAYSRAAPGGQFFVQALARDGHRFDGRKVQRSGVDFRFDEIQQRAAQRREPVGLD